MTPEITIRPGTKDPVPSAPQAEFLPMDEYNTKLVANGNPPDYVNPEPLEKYDLVRGPAGVNSTYGSQFLAPSEVRSSLGRHPFAVP